MQDAAKKTILVIDDDPDSADTMRILLEDEGFAVLTASGAESGLETLRAHKPDLVLLDVMMPSGTEGFHLVWTIRKDPEASLRKVPIILLTAVHKTTFMKLYPDQSDGEYEPYEYMPVQGFLDKPATPQQIIEEITRALKLGDAAGTADRGRDSAQ